MWTLHPEVGTQVQLATSNHITSLAFDPLLCQQGVEPHTVTQGTVVVSRDSMGMALSLQPKMLLMETNSTTVLWEFLKPAGEL